MVRGGEGRGEQVIMGGGEESRGSKSAKRRERKCTHTICVWMCMHVCMCVCVRVCVRVCATHLKQALHCST